MPELTDARRWMRDGTTLLLAQADLDEAALGAPSALPGWSRKHLVAHVAANAEGVPSAGASVTLAGPLAEIAAYLTGRPHKLTTAGGDPAPDLGPWL